MKDQPPRFTAAYLLQRLSGNHHKDLTRFADDRQVSLAKMTQARDKRA